MRPKVDGFTIIETLCAFAILALAMVALYGVGGTSFRILAATSSSDDMQLLAQSKLAELSATAELLPHFAQGTFPGSDKKWRLESRDVPSNKILNRGFTLQQVRLSIIDDK